MVSTVYKQTKADPGPVYVKGLVVNIPEVSSVQDPTKVALKQEHSRTWTVVSIQGCHGNVHSFTWTVDCNHGGFFQGQLYNKLLLDMQLVCEQFPSQLGTVYTMGPKLIQSRRMI